MHNCCYAIITMRKTYTAKPLHITCASFHDVLSYGFIRQILLIKYVVVNNYTSLHSKVITNFETAI
jgi:hypothetical protein